MMCGARPELTRAVTNFLTHRLHLTPIAEGGAK